MSRKTGKNYRSRKQISEDTKYLINTANDIFHNNYEAPHEIVRSLIFEKLPYDFNWPMSYDELIISITDFFETYHALTRLYLEKVSFMPNDTILEPCAGNSSISNVLRMFNYFNITEIDINPRNDNVKKMDFIKDYDCSNKVDHIVTNTPFKKSIKFMEKSSIVAKKSINFLWPLDYQHGKERYKVIYKNGINGFFHKTTYPFVRRPLFSNKYRVDGKMPTGATSFAWFEFWHESLLPKDYDYSKTIHLDNSDDMGVPMMADELTFEDLK